MFLLMVLIGIGFGLLAYKNGALLESGTAPDMVKATVDGMPARSYIVDGKDHGRE